MPCPGPQPTFLLLGSRCPNIVKARRSKTRLKGRDLIQFNTAYPQFIGLSAAPMLPPADGQLSIELSGVVGVGTTGLASSPSRLLSVADSRSVSSRSTSSFCRIRSGGFASRARSKVARNFRLLRRHAASDPISVAVRISSARSGMGSVVSSSAWVAIGGLSRARSAAAARLRTDIYDAGKPTVLLGGHPAVGSASRKEPVDGICPPADGPSSRRDRTAS